MAKIRLIRRDGVSQRYPIKNKNISRYTPVGRGLFAKKVKIGYKKPYYRTLVSQSYYARSTSAKTYTGRICQYYVFVISDEKGRYSLSQMEKIENHLSLVMSMSAGRSNIRWKNSVYDVPEGSKISSLGEENNVPIDHDEIHGYKINHVYRTAIFFKHGGPVEYGEENIKMTERRLNDNGDLDTQLENETGRLRGVR
jgi:hypothetical protein